jgi:predicted DNA-binding transcriptional regulator AlpA
VVARLGTPSKPQAQAEKRYVREREAAGFLGVSVSALRSWRGKRSPSSPPFTKVGGMVMYSVKELEQFMEERTVETR